MEYYVFLDDKNIKMLKNLIKLTLQKLLGFDNYLFIFSLFIIKKLKWDKNEKDFIYFLNLIPDNGCTLDIGANIGIMTVHLARKLKNSTIYAFEPVPRNIKTLKRIIKFFKLKNVEIFECALGEENGKLEMVMPVINSVKMQGLSHVVHESIKDNNNGDRFVVPVRKLDNISEINFNTKVNAIKIDVENYEYFVLKGGRSLITEHQPIIYCELWEQANRKNTIELLENTGYDVKVLERNELADYTGQKTQNFFFIPSK